MSGVNMGIENIKEQAKRIKSCLQNYYGVDDKIGKFISDEDIEKLFDKYKSHLQSQKEQLEKELAEI